MKKILVLGAGGIVIGQACEFDYSGTQAVKALRQEGFEVVLVNPNPATIMTDPDMAERTYVEPLTPFYVEKILERERPDALLPTVGGQTALNLTLDLHDQGILEKYGVKLLGASVQAIRLAEDRQLFRQAMLDVGIDVPSSRTVTTFAEADAFREEIGLPLIIRPSFTLGGSGGGIAHSLEEFEAIVERGLRESPVTQVLIEQSLEGWKEFELEVMRDRLDNFVVVCSIENLDPMGVHTGDSITVAPALTLTDKEYQQMREWGRLVIRTVGVETGGSNIQFGVDPKNGRMVVIEMNPRVSRSSALASKATGFPIAKIAAKLAVGYTLDQIKNDITRVTPASFEPVLDYVVVKIPRWDFAKFPGANPELGPQMKSVGEVMSMGATFPEALQKALRSLEIGVHGLEPRPGASLRPTPDRIFALGDRFRAGATLDEVFAETQVDPWFLDQLLQIVEEERRLSGRPLDELSEDDWRRAKQLGFSDVQLGRLLGCNALEVRRRRQAQGVQAVFRRVDTCAAEFEAFTPYLYSCYASACEADVSERRKVIILGSGPNRIGQGLEFDTCCVQASLALREAGYETIMVNCNPETVSTDYDTSDRLYFEPLTLEDVLNVVEVERSRGTLAGVIVQFGGQTPLKLVHGLTELGVPILGSGADVIDRAEDREQFSALLDQLEIPQPRSAMAANLEEAHLVAEQIGYPVLVRPSYVLGGRAMAIVGDRAALAQFVEEALTVSDRRPVLIDQFLEDAFEVDVDALCDGEQVYLAGVMQHIEEAGVHSGDSACVLPPYKVSLYHLNIIRDYAVALGLGLGVRGLLNLQMAVKDDLVYVLEVNPRASRTVPFVSKATGIPFAKLAARVMAGEPIAALGLPAEPSIRGFFVKEALLPFRKFPGVDARLGPEMRSTGEVMGHDLSFGLAFAKSQIAAGCPLPENGTVLMTVNDFDKATIVRIGRDLARLGFRLAATAGTAQALSRAGLEVETWNKVSQGSPHVVDAIREGRVHIVINTPLGTQSYAAGGAIRRAAIEMGLPLLTTTSAAQAAVAGIRALKDGSGGVRTMQELRSGV